VATDDDFKAFRQADMHTGHTYSLRSFAYRERDVADWRTHQGVIASIPESN